MKDFKSTYTGLSFLKDQIVRRLFLRQVNKNKQNFFGFTLFYFCKHDFNNSYCKGFLLFVRNITLPSDVDRGLALGKGK